MTSLLLRQFIIQTYLLEAFKEKDHDDLHEEEVEEASGAGAIAGPMLPLGMSAQPPTRSNRKTRQIAH